MREMSYKGHISDLKFKVNWFKLFSNFIFLKVIGSW